MAVVFLFNAIYPTIGHSSSALVGITTKVDDRIKSQVSIVHAVGELTANGTWQDSNSDGDFDVFVWVKNVGDSRILGIDQSDVFFGQEGNFSRIPYGGVDYPRWEYQIENNNTEWGPAATLKVNIIYSSASYLSPGTYLIKVITPNGVGDEDYFSM